MSDDSARRERLTFALGLLSLYRSPQKIAGGLVEDPDRVHRHWRELDTDAKLALESQLDELERQHVDVVFLTEDAYPTNLRALPAAPPMLFFKGQASLLHAPSVGMCGSRDVSESGLKAARACGSRAAAEGLVVVSGYAKGVDTETHLAALESGGRTVVVLAEGILRFRTKRVFMDPGLTFADRTLIVSQFPPGLRWHVGAAMARNAVIAGLGRALVVIEAGATGGTLDAGLKALSLGRPVIALEFSGGSTPEGNKVLFERGALRAASTGRLAAALRTLADVPTPAASVSPPQQMSLRPARDLS